MIDNVALADVGRQLRRLAKMGGLFVTYPKAIRDEMWAGGISDVDVLNVLRTGAISELTGVGKVPDKWSIGRGYRD